MAFIRNCPKCERLAVINQDTGTCKVCSKGVDPQEYRKAHRMASRKETMSTLETLREARQKSKNSNLVFS
jgi:hypothetical protein